MSPQTSPLKDRDPNTSSPTKTASTASKLSVMEPVNEKPKSMEYHRQVLQSKLEKDQHKYISPSDMLLSPATKKLSLLKGKRFGKATTSSSSSGTKSLFADTMTKNHHHNNGGTLSLDATVAKDTSAENAKGEEK
ncbi:MAG: hypothetical protein Q9228_001207 [Teloschistes exilis]